MARVVIAVGARLRLLPRKKSMVSCVSFKTFRIKHISKTVISLEARGRFRKTWALINFPRLLIEEGEAATDEKTLG